MTGWRQRSLSRRAGVAGGGLLRPRSALLILTSVIASCCWSAVASANTPGPTSRVWTLEGAGRDSLEIRPGQLPSKRVQIPDAYELPKGAHQGGPAWYVGRLHYRVEIDARSGTGSAYLSASTNGRTFAQIRFDIVRRGGTVFVRSDSLGLVQGRVVRESGRRSWSGVFENYLQDEGVRGGKNSYEVTVEQLDRARVSKAVVFSDSGIVIRGLGPARLGVQTHFDPPRPRLGEDLRLMVVVKNVGGIATPAGVLSLSGVRGVATTGSSRISLPPLRQNESVERKFYLRVARAGSISVSVEATAGLSNPVSTASAIALPRRSRHLVLIVLGSAAILAALLGALLVVKRRSSRV
jgi:hypothetical protein